MIFWNCVHVIIPFMIIHPFVCRTCVRCPYVFDHHIARKCFLARNVFPCPKRRPCVWQWLAELRSVVLRPRTQSARRVSWTSWARLTQVMGRLFTIVVPVGTNRITNIHTHTYSNTQYCICANAKHTMYNNWQRQIRNHHMLQGNDAYSTNCVLYVDVYIYICIYIYGCTTASNGRASS